MTERVPPTRALPRRLHAIAQAVPPGARLADVGTDHAQLLAWLRNAGRIAHGIGIDLRPGPLAAARRTLTLAQTDGVELRQGDGLRPLTPGEVDTVVLAGMGGATIVRLLAASPEVVYRLTRLVLQPNTDWADVRRFIATRRWALEAESMVEDRGKFYVVLGVAPRAGEPPGWSDDAMVFGPRLLRERPPAFEAWLRHELGRTHRALARARRGRPDDDPRVQALGAHARRLQRTLNTGSHGVQAGKPPAMR